MVDTGHLDISTDAMTPKPAQKLATRNPSSLGCRAIKKITASLPWLYQKTLAPPYHARRVIRYNTTTSKVSQKLVAPSPSSSGCQAMERKKGHAMAVNSRAQLLSTMKRVILDNVQSLTSVNPAEKLIEQISVNPSY